MQERKIDLHKAGLNSVLQRGKNPSQNVIKWSPQLKLPLSTPGGASRGFQGFDIPRMFPVAREFSPSGVIKCTIISFAAAPIQSSGMIYPNFHHNHLQREEGQNTKKLLKIGLWLQLTKPRG